ncbi:MAG: CHAT domain-containing protein [Phormidesmis sp.]
MIQEFKISITAMGGDQYLIRTEYVEKGVQLAEEKVHWPVAEWLAQTQSLMHDPLLGLLQGQLRHTLPSRAGQSGRKSTETADDTLVRLGQTLHDALFQGQLHDSWVTAQGVAQNRQDLLRLRIGMKDSRLQQLPWEALHARALPLATGTDVIFSRYILARHHGSASSKPSTNSKQVLRILMVIASPDDQERLELKREVYHLQSELHPEGLSHGASDDETLLDVQLKILEQPDRAELTQELDRGNYQVLHYAGHSNLGNAGGDLYLVSHQTGLTERLSGEDLAGLLVNNGIKLAVFNSCRGSYSASSEQGWQERNLAQALVNRGMPGVIAMSDRIPDHVAITFTQLLYRNLKKGQSIDLSLNRTRQGLISAYGSHQFYWALPTLYMQPSFDGYLVRAIRIIENADALDSANDPYGDLLFSEPELASISLPRSNRRAIPASALKTANARPQSESDATAHLSDKTLFDAKLSDREVNEDLVDNNDTDPIEDVVKRLSVPLAPVEVDGELRVPEGIETPRGFYGEPTASDLNDERQNKGDVSPSAGPSSATADISSAVDAPEAVGERLTRSHTLHTKLLTLPTLTSLALAALLGITTIAWWQQRSQRVINNPVTVSQAQRLVSQAEVAFDSDNLDAAVMTTKTLIDNGDYQAAINALDNAKSTQERDPIVAFFRGRAQWGLARQGNTDFAAADAMRSWSAGLAEESDWMEFTMALGFSQLAVDQPENALDTFQKAIDLAVDQPNGIIYFSDQSVPEYAVNAYAGLAMAALDQSKIAIDPSERAELLDRAVAAYSQVLKRAPGEFSEDTLSQNWLWTTGLINDWEQTKEELSRNISVE